MCISPITIDNPYYRLGEYGQMKLHNTHDSKLTVPCGSCWQCISMRQAWVNQRVQMESLRSYLYFFTLTYKNDALIRINIGEYNIAYPYYKDIQNMFKRFRNDGHVFRYWVVSEYGTSEGKSHRPHFHGILAIPKKEDDSPYQYRIYEQQFSKYMLSQWKRNIGSNRSPTWLNLCDYRVRRRGLHVESTFDFHYITPLPGKDNDLTFYLSKYLFKYDDRVTKLLQKISLDNTLSDYQRIELRSCITPRSVMSKDFGDYRDSLVKNYILSCLSKNDILPQFYDINTGQSSLLSRYYRKIIPSSWYKNRFDKYSLLPDSLYLPKDEYSLYDDILNYDDVDKYTLGLKNIKNILNSRY